LYIEYYIAKMNSTFTLYILYIVYRLKEHNFPVHCLPTVVKAGTRIGDLRDTWFGIPKGTPILVGLGDLQCSFKAAAKHTTDAGNFPISYS